ncbi:hypothetical protein ACTXT7_005863 [Hymenolepis weldensis]
MPFNFQKFAGKKSVAKDSTPSPSASIIEKLQEAFDKFDTNNSGVLDLEEIQAALQELGKPHHASIIQSILNLKGLQNGITFVDFVRFFTNNAFN